MKQRESAENQTIICKRREYRWLIDTGKTKLLREISEDQGLYTADTIKEIYSHNFVSGLKPIIQKCCEETDLKLKEIRYEDKKLVFLIDDRVHRDVLETTVTEEQFMKSFGWRCVFQDHYKLKINPEIFTITSSKRAVTDFMVEVIKPVLGEKIGDLSYSLNLLEKNFSERDAENFVVEKLSGGKANYEEDQFLRALSELTVIKWFCLYTRGSNTNRVIYEPRLSERRNPEARFIRDNLVIDVEVKTPGFIPINNLKPKITPIILLNGEGRRELMTKCNADGIELRLPDINKLKQHLNDAASKFIIPENDKHFNVVYINWTYCDYPQYAFLEPYSLLMNENGVLLNKEIGKAIGFTEDVYEKITAVVVYNENIEGFVNQDLRHIWSHRTFALAINPYMKCDVDILERTLQMEQKRNIYPIPKALYDYYAKDGATEKDIKIIQGLIEDYNEQIEKYALC